MFSLHHELNRRQLIKGLACGTVAAWSSQLWTPGALAEELIATPTMTEGPFYPDKLPLDTDNDLLVINDAITPAVGEITHLSGRILSSSGAPLRNAFVEIWQVDNNGAYLNSGDSRNAARRDTNFQGYGRFLTDAEGRYYFRTIKPVPYPGRCPHIHVGISQNGKRIYTTQLFVNGHPQNGDDGILNDISDSLARETVLVDFKPLKSSKIGELSANFDVVLGVTPVDAGAAIKGGIGPAEMQRAARGRRS